MPTTAYNNLEDQWSSAGVRNNKIFLENLPCLDNLFMLSQLYKKTVFSYPSHCSKAEHPFLTLFIHKLILVTLNVPVTKAF